jgi:hypothetical protein
VHLPRCASPRVRKEASAEPKRSQFESRQPAARVEYELTTRTSNWQDCTADHDPALGQHRKACRLIAAFDDLDLDPATDPAQARLEGGALVSAIRVELEQEGMEAKQRRHHPHAAIAILHVGWMHEGVQQQALGVYEDMALLALDLLARIVAGRVDPRPPFSAPLTLWLSMMAAVGLGSRPACSRHWTNSA